MVPIKKNTIQLFGLIFSNTNSNTSIIAPQRKIYLYMEGIRQDVKRQKNWDFYPLFLGFS